jgi:hypothetical protein
MLKTLPVAAHLHTVGPQELNRAKILSIDQTPAVGHWMSLSLMSLMSLPGCRQELWRLWRA